MREEILREIKRLAGQNGGQPPGSRTFAAETGIKDHEWLGVYWARWGDALLEAGFQPNQWQERTDPDAILERLALAARQFGHYPTKHELKIFRRSHPDTATPNTVANHFGAKEAVIDRLREWVAARPEFSDVADTIGPPEHRGPARRPRPIKAGIADGYVYLIRSGDHHKIGRSDELERRVKQIRVALPEAAVLEHVIRTDDPPGIEAYWHRRFAEKRANGEWFKLSPEDVAAFKRRKEQ